MVEPIKTAVTLGGIHLPQSLQDDYNTGGVKLYRVLMVGPGWTHRPTGKVIPLDCQPGDRIFCHSYTTGPTELEDGRKIITYDQVLAILPAGTGKWWCKTHNREATHQTETGRFKCDPSLGGIMLPCDAHQKL